LFRQERIECFAKGSILHCGSEKVSQRVTVAPEDKLLVSREEAAQLLSISVRGVDYLTASGRLQTRRIGGRVVISVADLREYVRGDHPEPIVKSKLG